MVFACGGACDGRPHYSSLWMCSELLVVVVVGRSHVSWPGLFVFTQAKCVLFAVPPSIGLMEGIDVDSFACVYFLVCIRPYSVYSKAFSGRCAHSN